MHCYAMPEYSRGRTLALYRLEARMIGRSGGHLAGAAAAYRTAGRVTSVLSVAAYRAATRLEAGAGEDRRVYDYRQKRGVAHTEIMAPAGAPDWARDRQALWDTVERVERRKDAQLARELLVTLPRDVPYTAALAGLRAWVRDEAVAHGMVADIGVHAYGTALDPRKPEQAKRIAEVMQPDWPVYDLPRGHRLPRAVPEHPHAWRLEDGRLLLYQPHAHVLLTTRTVGPEGFGKKAREWGAKAQLYQWRHSWEAVCNKLLADHGRRERVTAKAKWKREAEQIGRAHV